MDMEIDKYKRDSSIRDEYKTMQLQNIKPSYIKKTLGSKYGLNPQTISAIASDSYRTKYNVERVETAMIQRHGVEVATTNRPDANRIILEILVK